MCIRDSDQGWKSSVARHKIVCQYCDQPFPRGIDDAAAGDAHGVAAEPHAHGQSLFAAGGAFFEMPVQVEGHPGQVPQIFQQGK